MLRIRSTREIPEGSVDFVGKDGSADSGTSELALRPVNPKLVANPAVPDDTRLWAALQAVSGGSWGGCVFDVERIVERLNR